MLVNQHTLKKNIWSRFYIKKLSVFNPVFSFFRFLLILLKYYEKKYIFAQNSLQLFFYFYLKNINKILNKIIFNCFFLNVFLKFSNIYFKYENSKFYTLFTCQYQIFKKTSVFIIDIWLVYKIISVFLGLNFLLFSLKRFFYVSRTQIWTKFCLNGIVWFLKNTKNPDLCVYFLEIFYINFFLQIIFLIVEYIDKCTRINELFFFILNLSANFKYLYTKDVNYLFKKRKVNFFWNKFFNFFFQIDLIMDKLFFRKLKKVYFFNLLIDLIFFKKIDLFTLGWIRSGTNKSGCLEKNLIFEFNQRYFFHMYFRKNIHGNLFFSLEISCKYSKSFMIFTKNLYEKKKEITEMRESVKI